MKAFHFRLERVLGLRRSQLQNEECKLEALVAQRARMLADMEAADLSLARERHVIESAAYTRSSELAAFEHFKQSAARERLQGLQKLAAQDLAIEKQRAAIVEARRAVMLLEKLREKRHADWQLEAGKEMEELTSDFTAAQWRRAQRG
jgi:flagellar export protein FliJ